MDLLVRATRYPEWDAGVTFAARLAGQLRTGLTGMDVVQGGIPPVWEYAAGLLLAFLRSRHARDRCPCGVCRATCVRSHASNPRVPSCPTA